MSLFQSRLSPIDSQARADVWLRVGTLGLTGVVAVVAMLLRSQDPTLSTILFCVVIGQFVLCVADVVARHLPARRR
ncbi:hypothetical protein SAMN05443637_1196 [Pseudonocardia thermophila]|jgi:hypothetical protein|uniref:Uncharacterized protein n=1 Tax=Pseudonocardia thermophila TaxID=1848 RepID=A0A1M6Y6C7_PSETH|nr:hypothetical protein [Pseudonocardia thermophila]SHL13806.1 hypothetical protein SAMN05443637_1196 [Pseudonocardia thermophila]